MPRVTLRLGMAFAQTMKDASEASDSIRVEVVLGDDGEGNRLMREMTDEIDRVYGDRDGSVLSVSAHPAELSAPAGALLVVRDGVEAIGCGALKRLDDETCEIKRMYLKPRWRGRGISAVLLEALERRARELGYQRARLDTGDRQPSARRLYEGAGYRPIPDYNGNSMARFWFERELGPQVTIRRRLRAGDAEAIVALHDRIYPAVYGVDSSFVDDIRVTLDELAERGWPGPGEGIWVVESEGEVAGCLALTDEGDGEGRVRVFLLAESLRGFGLGRRLFGELLAKARAESYERLTLSTFSDLRAAAHLYRDAGFELVGSEHAPRWGRDEFTYQHYELRL